MSARAEAFVRNWTSENVQNNPFLDLEGDGYDRHIEGLRTALIVAASTAGIALPEIEQAVGDLEDYVRGAFEDVYDPTVGGIKD